MLRKAQKHSEALMSQPDMPDKKHAVSVLRRIDCAYVLSIGSIMFVIITALLVVYQLSPPGPAAVSAPLTEFSAERALKHLIVIGQRPHPVGTFEHSAVCNYIQNELVVLGLSPEVQRTPTATNILVRLKGTVSEKAVLLVGHYDTVPTSPGASDDGSAVVGILETLRALKSSRPMRMSSLFSPMVKRSGASELKLLYTSIPGPEMLELFSTLRRVAVAVRLLCLKPATKMVGSSKSLPKLLHTRRQIRSRPLSTS